MHRLRSGGDEMRRADHTARTAEAQGGRTRAQLTPVPVCHFVSKVVQDGVAGKLWRGCGDWQLTR